MLGRVRRTFVDRFEREPDVLVRAPGRVNLLGAHVDYNDGFVLPGAIDRAVFLAAGASDGSGTLVALDLCEEASSRETLGPTGEAAAWAAYPRGVARVLELEGYEPLALDAVYGGDLPIGAGVSSSAAVEVAFFLAYEHLGGFQLSGRRRARLGRRVENEMLGVQSGVMDQFASIHGRAGHVVLLDCRSLEHELIPMPSGVSVVVADTCVRRTLVGSGFNDRRSECLQALELLRRDIPELDNLRDVTRENLELHRALLPDPLDRRVRHVVDECARVLAGAESLRAGDLVAFGATMGDSHRSSRDLYEVSIPELDALAETAWSVDGCYGARLAGGGFGGCVTCLVDDGATEELERELVRAYEDRFGRAPFVFHCVISDGAEVVEQGTS